jgi:hypothetical protein
MTDATISYVILSHSNAPQVLRLSRTIRALSPRARVLVRHDQPQGFIEPPAAREYGADLLVSGIHCRWGHWSLVQATLEAFQRACELHDPDWIVLISGQDYPITPLGQWEEKLLSGDEDAVMSAEPLVDRPSGMRARTNRQRLQLRYTHRWYWLPRLHVVSRLPASVRRLVRSAWFRCLYPIQAIFVLNQLPRDEGWALGIRRRSVPWSTGTPLYKGSQWIALSRRALRVSTEGAHAKRMQDYFATTTVPDEAYFQTVLRNARGVRVKCESVSWLRWDSEVAPHPVLIDEAELETAVRSGAPFARKFDELAAPDILDRIDRTMLSLAES